MIPKMTVMDWEFRQIAPEKSFRLESILKEWDGTPHSHGQCVKGVAVDCVRFVSAVIDEMFRTKHDLTVLPPDAAIHDRAGAMKLMRHWLTWFPHVRVIDMSIEPGDVVICSYPNGGPGHAMVAGTRPGELWHAEANRVCRTGYGFYANGVYTFHSLYRPDKETW